MLYLLLWIALVGTLGLFPLILVTLPIVLLPVWLPLKNMADASIRGSGDSFRENEVQFGQAVFAWIATLIVTATPPQVQNWQAILAAVYIATWLCAWSKVKIPVPRRWTAKWILRFGYSSQVLWIVSRANVLECLHEFMS